MNKISQKSVWVKYPKPNSGASLRLFCLPYAGGWSQIYRPWVEHLPPTIELCPLELPGRGPRLGDPPITNLLLLVTALADALQEHLDRPYAFFGHSMGGLLSFELARCLDRAGCPKPEHLFISSYRAPHLAAERQPLYNLPEQQFIEELRQLSGTPEPVLTNPELQQLVFPALRADFQAIETHQHQPSPPLNCPITVFGGLQDTGVSIAALEGWRQYTSGKFELELFSGDHFFLHDAQPLILQAIQQRLLKIDPRYAVPPIRLQEQRAIDPMPMAVEATR